MRRHLSQRFVLPALLGSAVALSATGAHASNPLEYPDNGAASFSRGGAWLALANEPIAAHYNPAALATQAGGFSVDQNLAYNKVCYDRTGADGQPEKTAEGLQYQPVCNARKSFPTALPALAFSARISKGLGIGLAVVPPATYTLSWGSLPAVKPGLNAIGAPQPVPAPYRYQVLEQRSVILFPTLGVGYEVAPRLRIGAGFIAGVAAINTTQGGIAVEPQGTAIDHVGDDGMSQLRTKDLFVPGAILSVHWSPLDVLDVAAWGRWISPVESTEGQLVLTSQAYNSSRDRELGIPAYSQLQPICRQGNLTCGPNRNVAIPNTFGNETFRHFKFPLPPEVRIGARFHMPRGGVTSRDAKVAIGQPGAAVDPLHDDVFDVELDASYTANSKANTIEVRFAQNTSTDGKIQGASAVVPVGKVPPNGDRWNGFIDSYGVRLGGQWNAVQDKLAIRAGTWFETRSQEPEWLQVGIVGATRGGFGGGIVLRQNFIDISFGFQRHWSMGLDNHGQGRMRTTITSSTPEPDLALEPPGVSAADRIQYRSHVINNGRVTQSANVFSLGGTVRF